ncbi:3-oxosteroid 1-dehydrogenase [Oligella sp. MSHR50489EDL]|uniref:FAD-binding protein n=1 Tax=Oligella sp. MSHR50489EDL TaxID=3139409 RepID=UPI003D815328
MTEGAIEGPKYYAVRVYPGDIGTSTGLITNDKAQVLDTHDQVINGLYALGNDMQSIFMGEYAGSGITLGPAITFAWICSNDIAEN